MSNDAASVLSVARGEIGYSRWTDPAAGTKYGRWYAQRSGASYYGSSGVPYCAMFVSWVFDQAGASCAGFPGAYCPTALETARRAGRVVAKDTAQPGDVAFFDWDGGVVDHVGIVELHRGSYIQTIEGNTLNGKVARRTRAWGVVAAIVRPNYGGSAAVPATPAASGLDVDGWWGSATTHRLQQVLGTPQDGVVSSQWTGRRGILKACTSGWEWVSSPKGSTVVRAMQRRLGTTADGIMGPGTVKALEAHYRTTQDGHLDGPSLTVKRLQQALNEGRF